MRHFLTKKQLAIILSKLKVFESPKVSVEQYNTDSEIAATILWNSGITREFEDNDEEDDEIGLLGAKIPKGVEVYEVNGPFSFGSAYKFREAMRIIGNAPKVRIIRMRKVPVLDATGIHAIEEVYKDSKRDGIAVILSGVRYQPWGALEKAGLFNKIGDQNIYDNIEESLIRAQEILTLNKQKLYN